MSVGGEERPGAQRDVEHGLFAVDCAGPSDDGRLGDSGQPVDDALDLLGVDVLASADDHVLGSVDEHQVSVLVEAADVAGVQPAVDEGLGGLLGSVQVAAHDVRPRDEYLAGLTVAYLLAVVRRTIRMVCPGSGNPTVPGLRLPSSGLIVLAHVPSDSP